MANVLLARMGEVTLKGLNRGSFEIQLKSNLKYRLKKFGNLKIYQSQSRIWIEPKEEDNPNFQSMASAEAIMKAVCQVFGIVSVRQEAFGVLERHTECFDIGCKFSCLV